VDGVDHDRNTEREGKRGLVGTGTGSTEYVGAGVEVVEGEVASEGAIVGSVPAPLMEGSEEEVGPRRPSEEVHDHSCFGWSHRSILIDRLRRGFRTGRAWPGSRASSR
jgi:hypothetical protein